MVMSAKKGCFFYQKKPFLRMAPFLHCICTTFNKTGITQCNSTYPATKTSVISFRTSYVLDNGKSLDTVNTSLFAMWRNMPIKLSWSRAPLAIREPLKISDGITIAICGSISFRSDGLETNPFPSNLHP